MGREVYTSNDQLGGGTAVMRPNGVSHMLAETHMDAVKQALGWLSYVSAVRSAFLPVVDITGKLLDWHDLRMPQSLRCLIVSTAMRA